MHKKVCLHSLLKISRYVWSMTEVRMAPGFCATNWRKRILASEYCMCKMEEQPMRVKKGWSWQQENG